MLTFLHSLKSRLLFLIFIIILPGFIAVFFQATQERSSAIETARLRAIDVVDYMTTEQIKIIDETPLVGGELLDSMKLVELCLALEDKASEFDFEFDWTSATAMSKSRGMFRTAGTLVSEFVNQMKAKK